MILGLLVSACGSEAPEVGVTISDIADAPEAYAGELVTVSGEVDDVLSPHAFKLGGDDFEDDLLVFSPTPLSAATASPEAKGAPLQGGDVVQVTGVVREFTMADVEADYEFDLDPQLETEYENTPGLFVDVGGGSPAGIAVTPRLNAVDTMGVDTTTVPADAQ